MPNLSKIDIIILDLFIGGFYGKLNIYEYLFTKT